MLPTALVKQAQRQKLDGIGICDHNSAENVAAVREAGEREGLQVLGGMEVTSSEEVHVLGFFADDEALAEMQSIVYENLSGENDESLFGEQLVADAKDEIVRSNTRLLIGSTRLDIDGIVMLIHRLGGIAVASHVDRESFSLIGQLGFIPEGLALDALELSPNCEPGDVAGYRDHGYPLVTFSDAHFLADIGKRYTTFHVDAFSFSEVVMAFRGAEGRRVVI